MRFSVAILPLVAALAAATEQGDGRPNPRLPVGLTLAHEARRDASGLARRTDVDPELVCGDDFVDCNNGFCCSSGQTCAGELYGYPVCSDPTQTTDILGGTAPATPYANIEAVLSSLTQALNTLTGMPTATGTGLLESATSKASDAVSKASSAVSSAASQASGAAETAAQQTGGASLGAQGGLGNIGMVAVVWGAAALGGAGWMLA